MNRNIQFELQAYPADVDGSFTSQNPAISIIDVRDVAAARGKAGRLAKKINGPVDLAYAGPENWEERYITTAAPEVFNKTGYRFERIG